jgi:hypothetical protein
MIYPSITTTTHNYLTQIEEAEKLGIKEICLFLTCLNLSKRQEFYPLLKKCSFKRFPLIHLRHDLKPWELDFLVNKLPTDVFNIHPLTEYPFPKYFQKFKDKIYIENAYGNPKNVLRTKDFVGNYAGVCIDFTHLEDNRLNVKEAYQKNLQDIDNSKIGCAHVGPINKKPSYNATYDVWEQESHKFSDLSEFDYLKNYPKKYFPEIMALEVENSLEEQLKAINYLQQIVPTDLPLRGSTS